AAGASGQGSWEPGEGACNGNRLKRGRPSVGCEEPQRVSGAGFGVATARIGRGSGGRSWRREGRRRNDRGKRGQAGRGKSAGQQRRRQSGRPRKSRLAKRLPSAAARHPSPRRPQCRLPNQRRCLHGAPRATSAAARAERRRQLTEAIAAAPRAAAIHCIALGGPIASIFINGRTSHPRRWTGDQRRFLQFRRCVMPGPYKILIMGASYGSLLASKILFGGHKLHLVCLPAEADLINSEGFRVRLPVRGRKDSIELDSRKLPGQVTAGPAAGVNPKDYDLVGLAMQEPQYRSAGVRELLDAVGKSRVPCMSIMNMPPLPYIKRIPGLDYEALKPAYTDPTVWDSFDPKTITLNSPDPQAIRPPDEKVNVLLVTLPTNFKVARFEDEKATAILRQLQNEIE